MNDPVFSEAIPNLLTTHYRHLAESSSISLEIIKERGYRSLLGKSELVKLGFTPAQRHVPGILIPLWGVDGNEIVGYQFRPDNPRINAKGKPVKYETPRGTTNHIDCPPSCQKQLADPAVTLWITEGVKKADALASQGECVVDMTGVWNWRAKNNLGGITASPDFDSIALNDRKVFLAFDSDYATNPSVAQAVKRLAKFLKGKKANVSIVLLPTGNDGSKIGVDDFLTGGHSTAELKALAVPMEEAVVDREPEDLERTFLFANKKLYLTVRQYDGGYGFAYLDDYGQTKVTAEIPLSGKTIKPRPLPIMDGSEVAIVGMPDENITTARLLSADELYSKIKNHLSTYIDLPELQLETCVYYILFTWFYTKVKNVGYLRFLADTGKGKSRIQKVVADLCFYPIFASGASTFSGIARLNNHWRGTLIMDEADTSGDKESQFVKYLNLGFERGKYYVLSDKQNPRVQEYFDPFAPKILAMRQPFKDNATEARVLSISPHETTNLKIPIILPEDYYTRMQKIRNELALFTLHHFNEVDANRMIIFDDMDIEPRLKQLVMPISIVCQLLPDGERTFREYLLKRQLEIRRVRSMSWEGSLVNLVYSIASGHADLGEEFAGYCDNAGQVQVVTPTMVSRLMKSSAKMVTQTLAGVGFEVEWRRVDFKRDGQRSQKPVRAYCIPDFQTWAEVTSRYYYPEDGEMTQAIPDVLKSHKFHRVPGSVASVTSVTDTLEVDGHVTVATDATHYFTRHGNNGNKPTDPCAVCGVIDWQRRDGGWICGHCHPEALG